ncbi:hypothetical protein JCM10550A_17810 [Methanogenium cariaci]
MHIFLQDVDDADETGDVYNVTTTLHKKTANIAKTNNGQNSHSHVKESTIGDRSTESTGTLRTLHE